MKRAGVPYFRLYDLRSTYATRLSAGGVADEWVIQMLRQGDSQVFKKYSQMKLQMKREALEKINRRANEMSGVLTQQDSDDRGFDTVLTQFSLTFTVSAHLLLSHASPIDSFSHAIRRLPPSIEKGLQGKNTVEFRILRDGNIQKDSLKVLASSQKSELDTASLGAVREAAPFGHLPENFSEPFIVLRMTFYYNLLPLMEPKKFQ